MFFTSVNDCIEWIQNQRKSRRQNSLDDFRKLCALFGNPQDSFRSIHVAGTNGKGSTVSYMSEVLMENGLKVGSYTSPYIVCYNERIQINKEYISDEDLLYFTNLILSKYDELDKLDIEHPAFFALTTLIAFLYFEKEKVDIAVIEVGIGGLLDDTNVINPLVSIISNVGYDHMNLLGNTINEIALQKLGIVKENTPLVTIQNDLIEKEIIDVCEKNNAPYKIVKKSDIKNIDISIGQTKFDYLDFCDIKLKMSGKYQTENASLVIEACNYLNKLGFNISKESIKKALYNTFWLGRLEIVSNNPLIILDGAHNVDAFERLVEYIKTIKENKKVRLIIAISANKDKKNMLDLIDENIADELIITSFEYKRSEEANILFSLTKHKNKYLEENVDKIISDVKKDNNPNIINIFAGSLYFVSEIRTKFI